MQHGGILTTASEKTTYNLLSHQHDLVTDMDTKILGLVSGVGAGKTYAIARKAIALMIANPGFDGIMTEPNFPLLSQILIPEFKTALEECNIPYKFTASESVFYCTISGKETRVLCKSMENYERLIGVNAAWVIMDEFDTARDDLAYMAYLKLLGRLRVGNTRQMVIVSTPEGYRAFYRIFIKEANDSKRLIRAKTADNTHLPSDYIETLFAQYPEQLIRAYLHGEFVNLTAGTVYYAFARPTSSSTWVQRPRETLHIGMDFNVMNMAAVVHILRDGCLVAVDEIIDLRDTPDMILEIKERYKDHPIYIYPDASGKSKSSKGSSLSDHSMLKQAGFRVRSRSSNPLVRDRVLSVNTGLEDGTYKINIEKCPVYVECLEQQAYDKNGAPDKKSGFDHANDAGGYARYYLMPVVKHSVANRVLGGF